jgi:hypothetical protein
MKRSHVIAALSVPAALLVLRAGNILGAGLVLVWVAATRTPWKDIGITRWPTWWRELPLAVVGGAALKIVLKSVVLPPMGVPPMNAAYHFLVGNSAALPRLLLFVLIGAGIGEELIWRGFLFERLKALFGSSVRTTIAIVAITSILFGLAHLHDQGWPGVAQSTIVGAVLGTGYTRLKRIWPVMVAHAAFDVTAAFMIYLNLEEWFAHLIWR